MAQPDSKPENVRFFWPQERIDALRLYARDATSPDNEFVLSKRLAWMREFCIDAPSWLQTFAARERLRVKAEAAKQSLVAACGQVDALLADIDALGSAHEDARQDAWARKVTSNVEVLAPTRPAGRMGEADPKDPDKPDTEPRKPVQGEMMHNERLWAEAHAPVNMKAGLEKIARDPAAMARLVGATPKMTPERPIADTVKVANADGTVTRRAPRTGYRMALRKINEQFGEEIGNFLAHDILSDDVSTRRITRAMTKFMGTHPTRAEAAAHCADATGTQHAHDDGDDVLGMHAGFVLEHDDGRCSWWRK